MDISANYAADYQARADTLAAQVAQDYGKAFNTNARNELNVLTVLLLYERANLREQGLQKFLELTALENWPQTAPDAGCWLQLARALEQERFAHGQPFVLPISTLDLDLGGLSGETPYWKTFDQTKYDFSACAQFAP